jgi:Icc-related predicted phosphoesterase
MELLSVADIHGSQYRLNLVLKNIDNHNPDMVIVCGDLTQFGPGEVAKNFLDQIPIETLVVTGNIDSSDVYNGIEDSKALLIEKKRVIKKGIPFFGIKELNLGIFNKIEENKLIDEKTIIVTHIPPYGTQDKVFIGMHGGSRDLRAIVDKYEPRLVLCGHIHEDPGFTKINNTVVVNCSMGKRGEGALVEINNDLSVELIE